MGCGLEMKTIFKTNFEDSIFFDFTPYLNQRLGHFSIQRMKNGEHIYSQQVGTILSAYIFVMKSWLMLKLVISNNKFLS